MKEIKFRAWLERVEKMVDISQINFIGEEIDKYEGDSSSGDWWGFQFIKLMQYTGLKDKNGVEIYEGDIIKQTFILCVDASDGGEFISGYHKGEVVVIASRGVCIKNPILNSSENSENYKLNQYKNVVGYRSEVIGNIYENSELLEVE